MSAPKIFFGAGLFNKNHGYNSADDIKPWLEPLLESKDIISGIDSAVAYQECEEWLGQIKLGSQYGFSIDTKLSGGGHPALVATKENVIAQAKESLSKIGIEQFGILYLHAPDARVPVEEMLSGFDALYKEGVFKHFGLANHSAAQIEEIVKACKANNFVLPSFFQGSYNPIARLPEDELLPVLRKHNITFVAYSPMAGSFLAKPAQSFRDDPESFQGRWNKESFLGKIHHFLYSRPLTLQTLDKWHEIAEAEGISGAEMAYRWVAYHSALTKDDGMVIGATTIEQWKSNLEGIQKGPLSPHAAAKIDALWTPELKAGSFLDHFQTIQALTISPM
ncbi:hypothetical protein PFICI_00552 [Pestalotiopsis fici W106-1]|uniref:NADP-dependent oxidoreductase domain-containing protein n=1 Tax=Pestalotiopsis fici (strain W106-1 / CGMCC3.15140) TaxID=1229662 RepID=W3XL62_PESFW|nr:uncharacterized protein PFICI_00552 [Pestalotiopsis fici W106-1]ETS86724.1 hypothetical protein PFICI_00552 [Pestalotiopsis fici W106-1]